MVKRLCNLIPPGLADEYGLEEQSRTFLPWRHTVLRMHAQLTRAIGLNDVCDSPRMNAGVLATIRGGATPSSGDNLRHANRERDGEMAQAPYRRMMDHLMTQTPSVARRKVRRGFLRRFRKAIHGGTATGTIRRHESRTWKRSRK